MRQLTSLDAQFLASRPPARAATSAGWRSSTRRRRPGGKLTSTTIKGADRRAVPLLPPLRWRLVEVPLGLDYPYWVEDADFDLDYHVRELALPAPGQRHQLAEQVARIVARPLDRARPLWEALRDRRPAGRPRRPC